MSDDGVVSSSLDGVTVDLSRKGVDATLAQFKGLGPEAEKLLQKASFTVAQSLAQAIAGDARGHGRQAARLAGTVKANRNAKRPTVTAGGVEPLFSGGAKAFQATFGSEFGSHLGHGFLPFVGKGNSTWFYATQKRMNAEIVESWQLLGQGIAESYGTDSGVTDGG